MKIHSTFNHLPISKKNSETSNTNQRSKIQRHYHTNTRERHHHIQPNHPNPIQSNPIQSNPIQSNPTQPNPTPPIKSKKKTKRKNVPRNLQSPHIPHRPRLHTHLRSISSHSRPLRVSFHPSHHYIPPPPSIPLSFHDLPIFSSPNAYI